MTPDDQHNILAWWGAALSTLLALVKIIELRRDGFRLEASHNFTSDEEQGNEVLIRNLSARPVILSHWELGYVSGRWPNRQYIAVNHREYDAGDTRIDAHATHTLTFRGQDYFSWDPAFLNGRRIYIRLHVAGRQKPLTRVIY